MRRKVGDEPQRIGAMDHGRIAGAQQIGVLLNQREISRCQFDDVDHLGASGQRLETERAGAGEKIEDARARQPWVDDAHPRFAHAIAGWASSVVYGRVDAASAPPAGNNSHEVR
jgi:hypothetical protein